MENKIDYILKHDKVAQKMIVDVKCVFAYIIGFYETWVYTIELNTRLRA